MKMTTNNNNESVEATSTTTMFADLFHNIPRHNLISTAAAGLLTEEATGQITSLISPLNFDRFGGWADEIKKTNPPNDVQTKDFLDDPDNDEHRVWHYVNLPLGCESYHQAKQLGFTRDNDVIQTIRICVLVLKDQSERFSKVNALRLIAHLVGDVHQPLHTGCGFVDKSGSVPKLVTDPQIIKQRNLQSDTGGNDLLLPGSGNMHSYWDGKLGGNIDLDEITPLGMPTGNNEAAIEAMVVEDLRARAREVRNAGGANLAAALLVERWAEEWADESLRAGAEAYRNINIVAKQGSDFKVSWEGETTSAGKVSYDARCAPILMDRMRMGVRNLADMLNEIFQ